MLATMTANRQPTRRFLAAVSGCLAWLALCAPAMAADLQFGNMKDAMQALAKDIERQLLDQGLDQVSIKTFDGPSGASASSRIAQALSEQLKDRSIGVANTAGSWSVSGSYFADMNDNGKLEVFIESVLKNQRGREQAKLLTPIITNEQETLSLFGVNANVPTQATAEQTAAKKSLDSVRAEAILKAIDEPQATIFGSQVKTSSDSPYAIEVLVAGQPLPAVDKSGAAVVDVKKGQAYAIRLINNSDEDVGITLTIDGINTLAFSENPGYKQLGKWVIAARSVGTVRGWHIAGNQARQFEVMDYGASAAAKFASTKDIGTITATFCVAFTGNPPADEPQLRGKGELATGLGAPTEQKLTDVVRKYGAVRAAISVRYAKPDESDLPPGGPVVFK